MPFHPGSCGGQRISQDSADNWKRVQERSPSPWQEEMMAVFSQLHLEEPVEGQNCTLQGMVSALGAVRVLE